MPIKLNNGSETWRLTEINQTRIDAAEVNALKDRIGYQEC